MGTFVSVHRQTQPVESDMRASILRAATELFAEKGFSGVSTRDIAARVGIKQASLYHHFADKKSIHDAVVANSVAFVSERFLEVLRFGPSPEERLRNFLIVAIELFDSSNPHSRITDRELMENGNENMTYLSDTLRAPYLELASLASEISPGIDAEHASFFIISLAYGVRKHGNIRQLLSRLDDLSTPRGMANSLADRTLRMLASRKSLDDAIASNNRLRELEAENERLRRALVDKVLKSGDAVNDRGEA